MDLRYTLKASKINVVIALRSEISAYLRGPYIVHYGNNYNSFVWNWGVMFISLHTRYSVKITHLTDRSKNHDSIGVEQKSAMLESMRVSLISAKYGSYRIDTQTIQNVVPLYIFYIEERCCLQAVIYCS